MKEKITTIILSVCFLALLAGGCQTNPVTGEEQFNLFNHEQEEEMGRNYAEQIEKELGENFKDEHIQNYVNSVGQKIAAVCHTPYEGFDYKVIDHNSVNAFALPGGYIYITTGMLRELDCESQMAAILAHETAHVTARHSAVSMSRNILIGIGMSLIGENATTTKTIADIVNQLAGMAYSRKDERQADEVGLDYLVKAGYTPDGMVETMEILNSQPGPQPFEFLSTHPNPENRIGYIKEDIYNKGYTKYKKTGFVGAYEYSVNVSNRLPARSN